MSTFAPSSVNEAPPVLPDGDPDQTEGQVRLFRYYKARPTGVNVYLYKAGSPSAIAHGRVTEEDPITLYNSAGVATSTGWEDIEVVFYGGHEPTTLIRDWEDVLTAAGYTVTP